MCVQARTAGRAFRISLRNCAQANIQPWRSLPTSSHGALFGLYPARQNSSGTWFLWGSHSALKESDAQAALRCHLCLSSCSYFLQVYAVTQTLRYVVRLSIGELCDIVGNLIVCCFSALPKERLPSSPTSTLTASLCHYLQVGWLHLSRNIHFDTLFACPCCGKADLASKPTRSFR